LLFVALFFAKVFYRMDLLTIGDFYHKRYGKSVEVITSFAIVASYLGWTSAQLTALGLVIAVLSGGSIDLNSAILIGAGVVVFYTIFGGMWSIIAGLLFVAFFVGDLAGGVGKVIGAAIEADRFSFWPSGDAAEWLAFAAAWMTMALGSIPQQDVFQRVTSAKDEKTAVRGTLFGAMAYFVFAFVPMFIAYSAIVIDPASLQLFESEDAREVQRILPELILAKTPLWAQALFFGALLSAILSTASGALLAPTALFTENVLKPLSGTMSDQRMLLLLRVVLILFSLCALMFALNSRSTMYEMVQNAYKVTLAGALVPLAAGVFWRKATTQGALLSVFAGLSVWLLSESIDPEALIPPQFNGLFASLLGMILGSLAPQVIGHQGNHGVVEKAMGSNS
jgi:Na+/proline symporter